MDDGVAFRGYQEGPLLFRPTYKYDVGTDNYDSSEKMRIPAWTGKLAWYGSSQTTLMGRRSGALQGEFARLINLFSSGTEELRSSARFA